MRSTPDVGDPSNQPSLRSAARVLARGWAAEPAFFWTGILGLALGGAGLIVLAAGVRFIAPEGDAAKPVAFNLALGVYSLTLALLVPLAGFPPRALRRWRAAQVMAALGSYALATVQTYRGIDPRVTHSTAAVDLLASILFGVLALVGAATFVQFAVRLFRRPTGGDSSLLLLAARYASVTVLLGYLSGLWMVLARGSRVGAAGDILPLHALGFHALQAVPLLAVFFVWGGTPAAAARRWLHLAGAAWVGACLAAGWQAVLGQAPFDTTLAGTAAVLLLFVWALAAARAACACFWRRVRNGAEGAAFGVGPASRAGPAAGAARLAAPTEATASLPARGRLPV